MATPHNWKDWFHTGRGRLTPEELSKLAELNLRAAITTRRACPQFDPMVDVMDADRRHRIGLLRVPKAQAAEAIALLVRQHRGVAVVFVMDTWLGPAMKTREEMDAAVREHGSVRQIPGRVDALVAIADAPEGRVAWCARYVAIDAELVFDEPEEMPGTLETHFLARLPWAGGAR